MLYKMLTTKSTLGKKAIIVLFGMEAVPQTAQ